MKFYFFEVLNYDKLLDGTADGGRPLLKERGPYTYREDREKKELNWTDNKEYLAFGQYKSYTFLPEESCEGCISTDEGLLYQAQTFMVLLTFAPSRGTPNSRLVIPASKILLLFFKV